MSEDMQQATRKKRKMLIIAAININWKESQNSVSKDMNKEWVLRESFNIQDITQQMKITMRDRKTEVRTSRNQKIRTCSNHIIYNIL